MKGMILTLILNTLLNSWASDFDRNLVLEGKSFDLKGQGLLEYSIFGIDLYHMAYYEKGDSRLLVLNYAMDIKPEYSKKGWDVGLTQNGITRDKYGEQIAWLHENVVDLKKGDRFIIWIDKDTTKFLKNGVVVAKSKDPKIRKIVFLPWLGEKPVDEDLKKKLLEGQS